MANKLEIKKGGNIFKKSDRGGRHDCLVISEVKMHTLVAGRYVFRAFVATHNQPYSNILLVYTLSTCDSERVTLWYCCLPDKGTLNVSYIE